MGGWTGRMLDVDLATGRIEAPASAPLTDRYVGGPGLGQAVIMDEIPVGTTALDPANIVVLSTGPLTATLAPGSSRLSIDTMNVLTGGVNSSNAGGHFAPELKYAGFDAIVIRGKAERPVYLQIHNGQARLCAAGHLWGKITSETENTLRIETGDTRARVLAIGPAGENRTAAGCVIVDRARAAGRGAAGSVLGSKNFKAVVVRGTRPLRVAKPEAFAAEAAQAWGRLSKDNWHTDFLKRYGTFGRFPDVAAVNRVGFRNSQDDHLEPDRLARVQPDAFVREHRIRKLACFNCAKPCSSLFTIRTGEYAGTVAEGLHLNFMEDFAGRLDIADTAALVHLQRLCSDLGLDIDNASGVLAWAFDCYEKGLITRADTGGLELRWGDHAMVGHLLEDLAHRRGFGGFLADGVRAASQRVGPEAERLALHVKGQELQETVRAHKGWALGVVVAPRGGAHLDGSIQTELWNKPPEFFKDKFGHEKAGTVGTLEGKPETVFFYDCFKQAVDALGVCYFMAAWSVPVNLWPDDFARLLSTGTGREYSESDFLQLGRRIVNLKKAFNTLHRGFTRHDDLPPRRLMEDPVQQGPLRGARLDEHEWNSALDRYYSLHGWDVATGWQTWEALRATGLEHVARRLAAAGRLREGGLRP
jgi:aldehyde:ferredoxin oxidoreductase